MAGKNVHLSLNRFGITRESTIRPLRSTVAREQQRPGQTGPRHRGPTKQRQQFFCTGSRHDEIRGTRIRNTTTGYETSRVTASKEEEKHAAVVDMSSDQDYLAFLNKANNEADEAHAKSSKTARAQLKTLDAGQTAPQGIVEVCKEAVYTSDADEPFEPVSLKFTGAGGLPDEEEFAELIEHWDVAKAEISILDPLDWDSNGQYRQLLEVVRDASKGNDVRVYRVVRDTTRVEYWVITRAGEGIVGAKALAVES
ncbi:hypothetical protein MY1884_004164 [Beauveria asiatica]